MGVQAVSGSPKVLGKVSRLIGIITTIAMLHGPGVAIAGIVPQDINPNNSDLDSGGDPDGASGGRVNGLASSPGSNAIFYAATEWGGVYKTTDGGVNWARLNGHRPVATWDVEVDPSNANRVYATSFYDGRATGPQSGINVSTDGGATWTHPASANPPVAYNCAAARRTEPSAFGIGIRPDAANNVFIGTNCGVAISTNSGATWTFVDPTPATAASDVWDVVVQGPGPSNQGIVDICGDDGHLRSTDGGANWVAGTGLPSGQCAIAASPDESYVLFATVGAELYETNNADRAAGAQWAALGNPEARRGSRIPFVVTNQRANSGGGANLFDLWVGGAISVYRGGCTTPATPASGGANRCPAGITPAPPACPPTCPAVPAGWAGGFTRNGLGASTGAHDDVGDLVFDRTVATDACPRVLSSDGGVYRNTDTGADCQNPDWDQPNVTPHALWVYGMSGVNQAGNDNEDLYIVLQDDGSWVTRNAGAATPTWNNRLCCDGSDVVADANRVIHTFFSAFSFNVSAPGMTGTTAVATNPPGMVTTGTPTGAFNFPDFIARYGNNQYIAVTPSGGFITTDITVNPVVWTQLGAASTPAGGFCAVHAAVTGGTPTFYAQTSCIGVFENQGGSQLWKYTGTAPGGTWTRVDNNSGLTGGFGIAAVDPNNPNRLYASNLRPIGGPQMVFSTDGGTTWNPDAELDALMTGGGVFQYQNQRGPTSFTGFNGYAQPSLVAFDAEDSNVIVAGGRDSGVFLSTNAGQDWSLITDPFNSHTSGRPHIPRPWFAYFDHEPAGRFNLFVGTQGRGVWRFRVALPSASAGGPYTTNEGTNASLSATGSDPDGQAVTFAWDLDNDGTFETAGQNVTFDRVGQDGVFTVRVKVSTADGAFSVATTTVTVNNVAPSVSLSSNAPKPENSAVTVSGTVTDPGWLDPLTANVDWGDGSAVETISGTLENVRPDATLTFSIPHTYGDNGTFTAKVCARDDDTETCQTISLQITNVNPTAVIDESGATLVNGVPTFIAHAGAPLTFSGRSQDPGSDDLALSWDWNDGPPVPDVTTTYLVNPPNPDPLPSPSIQPRDVTDSKTHAFLQACFYEIRFLAADDDGGSGQDTANVIIVGNATQTRTAGYWGSIYSGRGPRDFDATTLDCYLRIAGFMSRVFNEVRNASTNAAAADVLNPNQVQGNQLTLLDQQLLAAWLNFANGTIGYTQLVDTNGDRVPDTSFATVMTNAENVRLNPASTAAQLEAQKNILESINLISRGS